MSPLNVTEPADIRSPRSLIELAGWLLLCLAAGLLGAAWTIDGVRGWYPTIRKPTWTPPNALFGPVWTMLYLLMGVAAFRISRLRHMVDVRRALVVFLVQLVLNAAWSFLFFGSHLIGVSFAEIALLLATILLTIALFARIETAAGVLLIPYALWVSYATALNGSIWWLNRT